MVSVSMPLVAIVFTLFLAISLLVSKSEYCSQNSTIENQNHDVIPLLEYDYHAASTRNLASVPDTSLLWNTDYRSSDGKFWIKVRIGNAFSASSRKKIISSLTNLQQRSRVIKFNIIYSQPQSSSPYLHLRNSYSGCWSKLGRTDESTTSNGQIINLDESNCMDMATIQHEMMHALGFGHEQSRLDRDDYIIVNWNNIIPQRTYEFYKIPRVNSLGTPYDMQSIMHYRMYEWSNGRGPTIVPREAGKTIGGRSTASAIDILQIQLMYQCSGGPRNFNTYQSFPCSNDCQCWKGKSGCQNRDSYCKGDLVCRSNVCQSSQYVGITPTPGPFTKQLVKSRIQGKQYYMVPGVMFDIFARSKAIYVTNLIFKGLGVPNSVENVQVDVYTKKFTHSIWSSSPSQWSYVVSATLTGDGTDDAQVFLKDSFPQIKINAHSRQAFYIHVKNCDDTSKNCHKLRAWEGGNYSKTGSPYVKDENAMMLEGCILGGQFNNMVWETCKNSPGGKSYTFWGGFEYRIA